jgi:hypothetical protein
MITFRSSYIQNADLSRKSSIRYGGARAKARSRSQLAHRSAWRNGDTYARNGLFMCGNVVAKRTHGCRLPSRSSSAALNSP